MEYLQLFMSLFSLGDSTGKKFTDRLPNTFAQEQASQKKIETWIEALSSGEWPDNPLGAPLWNLPDSGDAASSAAQSEGGSNWWSNLTAYISDIAIRIVLAILGIVLIGAAVKAMTSEA